MIKIIALAAFMIGQLQHVALDGMQAVQKLVNVLHHALIQVCDNVDPGDEDGYE